MRFIHGIIHPIIDFIYPPICAVCENPAERDELPVCSSCWNSFTPITPEHTVWIEIKSKLTDKGCVHDIQSCYLFENEGKFQQVIHLLKYKGMKSLGMRLGNDIGNKILSDQFFKDIDYIVPVPLHNRKRREREYNQSELLCRGISQILHIPVEISILKRWKYTQTQTKLNLEERSINVDNAFLVSRRYKQLVKGKSFIIVDDVITTGSTIGACARELVSNGADKIYAVSAALAR